MLYVINHKKILNLVKVALNMANIFLRTTDYVIVFFWSESFVLRYADFFN